MRGKSDNDGHTSTDQVNSPNCNRWIQQLNETQPNTTVMRIEDDCPNMDIIMIAIQLYADICISVTKLFLAKKTN
ncbi:Acetyl-coenzyme A synthetase [Dirofilaria immitis]